MYYICYPLGRCYQIWFNTFIQNPITWKCSLTYQFLGDSGKSYSFPKHLVLSESCSSSEMANFHAHTLILNWLPCPYKNNLREKEGKLLAFQSTFRLCEVSTPLSLQQYLVLFFCSSLPAFLPFHFLWHRLSFYLSHFHSTPALVVLVCASLLPSLVLHRTSAQCANPAQQNVPRHLYPGHVSSSSCFFNPFKHLGEVEHNSCMQVLYKKGGGICWFNPIVQLWRWSQASFKGCFQRYHERACEQQTKLREIWVHAWSIPQEKKGDQ